MREFKGKDFEIVNHTFTIKRTPVIRQSMEFVRDLETGEILRDKYNQPVSRDTEEYRITTNYKFTFTIKDPDGNIRAMSQPELVNTFGKRRYKKAYAAYYKQKAGELDQLAEVT